MTSEELDQLRVHQWRLDGRAIHTIEDARAFVESVGFCMMYPMRQSALLPTFMGACAGSAAKLPTWQHAFSDPRAAEATNLMVRLLRERAAFEANLFDENNAFLIAASVFPYFYALAGERNPKHAIVFSPRLGYSQLECDAFEVLQRDGPLSRQKLITTLGGSVSAPALDHALNQLWSRLRITRVDYSPSEGASWDVLYRWAEEAVQEGVGISVPMAISTLIYKYLECVVAADEADLETFFSNFVSRARLKETVNALLSARQLSFVYVGTRSLIQITPEKPEPKEPLRRSV